MKKIIWIIFISVLLFIWYYYLFAERSDIYEDKTDWKVYEIQVEDKKDATVEIAEVKNIEPEDIERNWPEDLKFTYCDNIWKYSETSNNGTRLDFFWKWDGWMLDKKMDEYNAKKSI